MQRLKWWLGMTVTGIYRAPLKKPGKSPPESVRASLASAADLAPFVGKRGYELSPEFVAGAFARDDLCVATYVDGAFAAYGWVAYRTAPHVDGVWVQFAAGQRYNYKNLTLPEYRGRHIRGSFGVLQTRDQYEGVTHSLAFIETHNYASIRAEKRNGGQRVGYAGYVELLGKRRFFRTPGAARYGFRFCAVEPAAPQDA